MTVILSFMGKNKTLSHLILSSIHPTDRVKTSHIVTKYNNKKPSLLLVLKRISKNVRKEIKADLKPLWKEE